MFKSFFWRNNPINLQQSQPRSGYVPLPEYVAIPKELLVEPRDGLTKLEEVLATMEELADKEGQERTKRAEDEYRKSKYVFTDSPEEIKCLLK